MYRESAWLESELGSKSFYEKYGIRVIRILKVILCPLYYILVPILFIVINTTLVICGYIIHNDISIYFPTVRYRNQYGDIREEKLPYPRNYWEWFEIER